MVMELASHGYNGSPGSLYATLDKVDDVGPIRSHSEIVQGRVLRSNTAIPIGRRELEAHQAPVLGTGA